MGRLNRAACVALSVLCAFVFLFSLFLPPPRQVSGQCEGYRCVWDDGTVTEESYESAYLALDGVTERGIRLLRGGIHGEIAGGEEFLAAREIFENGNLGDLYAMRPQGNRLERAALWDTYGERIYYDGGAFMWTGERILRVSNPQGKELVLLRGSVPASVLRSARVETLLLRADALFSPRALLLTSVTQVLAQAPYSAQADAVYLDTPGGRRLVSALPLVKSFRAEDCDFADMGALSPCEGIREVDLPFLGNAETDNMHDYVGDFGWVFRRGDEYTVPESLKRVRVRGGAIVSYAFYSCSFIEEVNACGVDAARIDYTAFAGMPSLRVLHTPRRDVRLSGRFTSSVAPCGCTVYERVV